MMHYLGGKSCIKSGTDKSVIGDLYRLRASAPRSEIVGPSGNEFYPLGDGLGTVSCGSVASNDPSWSSLHFRDRAGGSKLTDSRPKSLHNQQIS
jgi:hypothetical protein